MANLVRFAISLKNIVYDGVCRSGLSNLGVESASVRTLWLYVASFTTFNKTSQFVF